MNRKTIKNEPVLLFLGIFVIYLGLRLFAWKNTILFEDHDSLSYLNNIKTFLTFNLRGIINLDADSTPFYPFFGALFSLPGWSIETGARLCSLFFSSILFIAVVGIGKRIASPLEVAIGLLILSFSPVLISLSFSVLSEPSYIAIIYLGFWFFWMQYRKPNIWKGGLLGVIFGLSFLNRVEGILYLAVIPLFQGVYFFGEIKKNYSFKRFIGWTLLFIVCFSLIAIPQILRVSYKMGRFAINGRQAWSLILNYPDGKSYDEKIRGLDYSPSQTNIYYVESHPEVLDKFATNISLKQYIKTSVINFKELYQRDMRILISPLGFIFFSFGLLSLYKKGHLFETFIIVAFIGFNLIPPLLHNVVIRHITIIAPIMILIEGVGILYISDRLSEFFKNFYLVKYPLPFVFLLCIIGASVIPLYSTFNPPYFNREYSPDELKEPISIIKKITKEESLQVPVISSKKAYLAYFAGVKSVNLPYTSYEGLLKYCDLNNVDFLYLKYNMIKEFPFLEAFLKNTASADFVLLYSGIDPFGEKIELYRYQKKKKSL